MESKKENFLKKLMEDFKIEASEHRSAIIAGLLELEKASDQGAGGAFLENVFREFHSLKGAARAVNLANVERFCQAAENIFTLLKQSSLLLTPELIDSLHSSINILDILLTRLTDPLTESESSDFINVIHMLEQISEGMKPEPVIVSQPVEPAPDSRQQETVRIAISKLNEIFLQAEELINIKLTGRQYVAEIKNIKSRCTTFKKALDRIKTNGRSGEMHTSSFQQEEAIELQEDFIKSTQYDLKILGMRMENEFRSIERVVDGLITDMKKTMMLPISSILDIIHKAVRDLAHYRGKKVELNISGGETEIDRRILEMIKDPILHIVRNCIDYGIETPDVRELKGKEAQGAVTVNITQKDNRNVEISISDDGAGIDYDKVKNAAVRAGIITREAAEKIPDIEVLNYVFISGVSTSPIITDISGRGIGLAIVQEKVAKLGGTVSVTSVPDSGTSFTLLLPLMQATFRGVIIGIGSDRFIIPIQNVERVVRVDINDIKKVENRDTIVINSNVLPVVRLQNVLGIDIQNGDISDSAIKPVIILAYSRNQIAFMIDEVIGEQEGIVKRMGKQLQDSRFFSGATVSGSGKLIPILDVGDLMDSAIGLDVTTASYLISDKQPEGKRSILIAEDSITSRSLLKNILESAGYNVKTAVDGMEAFSILKEEEIELLVSDVDMPRMNGFELTTKIRNDKYLVELPVVLVTGLDSRDDRERGIEAGANAYIIKSSFDQSNLLEAIRRLI